MGYEALYISNRSHHVVSVNSSLQPHKQICSYGIATYRVCGGDALSDSPIHYATNHVSLCGIKLHHWLRGIYRGGVQRRIGTLDQV